jgi:hypothetical protein
VIVVGFCFLDEEWGLLVALVCCHWNRAFHLGDFPMFARERGSLVVNVCDAKASSFLAKSPW